MASGYSLDLVTSYDQNKDKHTLYTGTDCTKKLCDDLKDHAMDIINAEKKVIISLTDYKKRVYEKQNYCHICKRKFCYDKDNESKCEVFHKVRDHCHHTPENLEVLPTIFVIEDTRRKEKFQWCFIMALTTIII